MNPNLPTGETMSEGSPLPAIPHPEPDGDELCVPLKALGLPDEEQKMQNPAVGDVVTVQIDGKVTRIDGEMAYIEPTAANGEPISEDDEQPEPSLQDDQAALSQQAADLDKQGAML